MCDIKIIWPIKLLIRYFYCVCQKNDFCMNYDDMDCQVFKREAKSYFFFFTKINIICNYILLHELEFNMKLNEI